MHGSDLRLGERTPRRGRLCPQEQRPRPLFEMAAESTCSPALPPQTPRKWQKSHRNKNQTTARLEDSPHSRDCEKFLETRRDGIGLENRSKLTRKASSPWEPGKSWSRGERQCRPGRPPARGQARQPGCEAGGGEGGASAPQGGRAESREHDPGPEGLQTEGGAGPPGLPPRHPSSCFYSGASLTASIWGDPRLLPPSGFGTSA